ncbi:MAG: DUF3429 domain-containing protein [Wenzhouxiangellaceae bacterium]|jgi:hypothetical protein|nr:DUF3429 domain-containing protein [Wenzhouxiangellaceae bacterium]MBS3746051.1 DUF3429 domain-containing protein [Wenzhouxiangellaceae bacterium]MBS3822566.1 DUF3429 domain-containing protein [Wenzhouxiangellaceae bacterium]
MTDNRHKTARALGWAGLLPFAGLALAGYVDAPASLQLLLIGYALAILAFLNGSLWAVVLERPSDRSAALIASNLLLLAALPALLMPLSAAAGWLALLFALHLVAEWRWVLTGHPGWYRRLRLMLSSVAIALLVVGAMAGAANG